jgi:hypothetical protein
MVRIGCGNAICAKHDALMPIGAFINYSVWAIVNWLNVVNGVVVEEVVIEKEVWLEHSPTERMGENLILNCSGLGRAIFTRIDFPAAGESVAGSGFFAVLFLFQLDADSFEHLKIKLIIHSSADNI